MKFIATSDFYNTSNIEVEDAQHSTFVHKGALLTIGGSLSIDKMSGPDRAVVAALNANGRIVEAFEEDGKTPSKKAETIRREVAAEKQAKANQSGQQDEVAKLRKQVADLQAQLDAKKK